MPQDQTSELKPPPCTEPVGYDPSAETWVFAPSTKVRCITRKFADGGEGLVAVLFE